MKLSQVAKSMLGAAPLLIASASATFSTDLSNGAALQIELTSPFPAAKHTLGATETVADIPVRGGAHVGKGAPDVSYIYIIDSSSSTSDYDGTCGTTLECEQKFFQALHQEVIKDGSAKLTAVIDFDDVARMAAEFQDPANQEVIEAISFGISDGGTACINALELAALAVLDKKNTAGTTVVIFAGDGMCNIDDYAPYDQQASQGENVTVSADILAATGAIVHSIAVGDSVDCSQYNDLARIPRNGGECFSIQDPNDLPDIIDDIIGTNLTSLEMKIDNGNYAPLDQKGVSKSLPAEGAVDVEFNTTAKGLDQGTHMICVRATGSDSLGDVKHVEDCRGVVIEKAQISVESVEEESPEDDPEDDLADAGADLGQDLASGMGDALDEDLVAGMDASSESGLGVTQIVIVVGSILFVLLVVVLATRSFCYGKEDTSPKDLNLEEEVDSKEVGEYTAPGARRQIV